MAMAYRGSDCVVWYEKAEGFPFLTGISSIVASWVLSPVLSGVLAVMLFVSVRTFVLRSENCFERSFWVYPVLVCGTIAVNGEDLGRKGRGRGGQDVMQSILALSTVGDLGCDEGRWVRMQSQLILALSKA